MNLVQIQERLKDAPVQAIMQYANGGNPMVPPYLALAELKRRESINQSAQAQQAMQQGQQPSVKEQVEQAAGLAALQQQMQQQGMQGLMAQARPQGIPENIPQPQRQPESEGIAGLPAGDFNFADGGIVAFQGGGATTPFGRMASGVAEKIGDIGSGMVASYQESEEKRKLLQAIREELSSKSGITGAFTPQTNEQWMKAQQLISAANPTLSTDELRNILAEAKQLKQASATSPVGATDTTQNTGYAAKETARAAAVAQQPAGIPAALPPKKQPTGAAQATGTPPISTEPPKFALEGDYQSALQDVMAIKDPTERAQALQALQRSQQQAPTPQAAPQAGIAALPGAEQAGKMMVEAMQKQSTPEEIYQAQRKMEGLRGLTQPAGEERMQRLAQMEAERKKMLEERGMERLMRVMSGIAGRGLQGAGPAYLSAIEGERASDVAFRKQMDELMGGVEEKRRAEQMAGLKRDIEQMGEERKLSLGAAEKIFDAETRRKNEEFRIRLENQLRSMQPTEATILQRMIDDEMRRNPKLTLVEAYAKVKEAQQGATPEARARATQKDLLELALKEWNDQLIPMREKNPKNLTQEQWLQEKMRTYSLAMPSGVGGGIGGSSAKPQKPLTAYER